MCDINANGPPVGLCLHQKQTKGARKKRGCVCVCRWVAEGSACSIREVSGGKVSVTTGVGGGRWEK